MQWGGVKYISSSNYYYYSKILCHNVLDHILPIRIQPNNHTKQGSSINLNREDNRYSLLHRVGSSGSEDENDNQTSFVYLLVC